MNQTSAAIVDRLAESERLLVASDFDGVLAPIVEDPEAAEAIPGSLDALRRLAALRSTDVAVVSGRGLDLLTRMVEPSEGLTLVGSHGAELGVTDPSEDESRRLEQTDASLRRLASRHPGLHVERKAMAVAVHFRRLAEGRVEAAAGVESLVDGWVDGGGKVIHGKEVVEFALRHATKGDAVLTLVERLGSDVTIYLGDDTTDEDVFAVLGADDVGIKVGDGPTLATDRLASPTEVEALLNGLADARSATNAR